MTNDPIVDEVRRVRDELAKRFNYDVDAIFADLREKQKNYQDRIVYRPERQKAELSHTADTLSHPADS
jgi:hypothetical protein